VSDNVFVLPTYITADEAARLRAVDAEARRFVQVVEERRVAGYAKVPWKDFARLLAAIRGDSTPGGAA
jgi:hypothetical protein